MKARVKSYEEIEKIHVPMEENPKFVTDMIDCCGKVYNFNETREDNCFGTSETQWIFHKNWLDFEPCKIESQPNYTETPSAKVVTCTHNGKYKNHAGGTLFWYCPVCKQDLGNV